MTTLLVIAKEPVPGRVKTRLTPPYRPAQAAALAEAALADTLDAVAAAPATRRVLVLSGRPGPWLPPGFEVVPQRGAGLDERLAHAFAGAGGPAVLIGMDTPQVTPAMLARAAHALDTGDAVFGPADDGGWWLLGLRDPDPRLLLGVPMSRADTGAHQLARLRGLRVTTLDTLTDVDTADDAARVAAQAPATRFAATLTALRGDARPAPAGGPASRTDEPASRTDEPASRADGPAARNAEPAALTSGPAAQTGGPAARTDGGTAPAGRAMAGPSTTGPDGQAASVASDGRAARAAT